jgi:hypothetical protein
MTGFAQFPGQIFLQLVTSVISGDADALERSPQFRQRLIGCVH